MHNSVASDKLQTCNAVSCCSNLTGYTTTCCPCNAFWTMPDVTVQVAEIPLNTVATSVPSHVSRDFVSRGFAEDLRLSLTLSNLKDDPLLGRLDDIRQKMQFGRAWRIPSQFTLKLRPSQGEGNHFHHKSSLSRTFSKFADTMKSTSSASSGLFLLKNPSWKFQKWSSSPKFFGE